MIKVMRRNWRQDFIVRGLSDEEDDGSFGRVMVEETGVAVKKERMWGAMRMWRRGRRGKMNRTSLWEMVLRVAIMVWTMKVI